jgi:hypothetical protein
VKQKDIIFTILAVVILLVAGYIGYTQLVPKKNANATLQVEKVGAIPAEMDSGGLAWLNNKSQVIDYNSKVDLSGLGNKAPFGP